jgi:hydrogenase maturation protease
MKPLVLGLGNDLLGDDGIGLAAARCLGACLGEAADVVESSLHGLALMDLMLGYRQAIIIDAIQTGQHPVGTVLELSPGDLRPVMTPSPHYSGLPEMMALAKQLGVEFPEDIRIIAVEIDGISAIREDMSAEVRKSLIEIESRVTAILHEWNSHNDRRAKSSSVQKLTSPRPATKEGV